MLASRPPPRGPETVGASARSLPADADERMHSAWEVFRAEFPVHAREIAVQPIDDELAIVVVSEPPDAVTAEVIVEALGGARSHVETRAIGHGGWLKDLVVLVPHEGPVDLHNRLSRAARAIHGTGFAFTTVELGATPKPASSGPATATLDLAPSPTELWSALTAADAGFRRVADGRPVASLREPGLVGAFVSDRVGVLSIPRGRSICELGPELRRFAVSVDVLLGAADLGSGSAVLIGRRRQLSTRQLPPLRFDELLRAGRRTPASLGPSAANGC